jgi:hypothetical protein
MASVTRSKYSRSYRGRVSPLASKIFCMENLIKCSNQGFIHTYLYAKYKTKSTGTELPETEDSVVPVVMFVCE